MKLESIHQELLDDTTRMITRVVIKDVASNCILARQMIDVLGRPGTENDMEMIGTNGTWTIVWTEPQLTLEEATHRVNQAIALRPIAATIETQL